MVRMVSDQQENSDERLTERPTYFERRKVDAGMLWRSASKYARLVTIATEVRNEY